VRAVWRRAQRQHPELPPAPTGNVDFHEEKPREAVVTVEQLPGWWSGVQTIENAIRRDFYIWLLFTGCRRGESETLKWDQVDFKKRCVHFPVTKTEPFDLPLSKFLVQLLKARRDCETTRAIYGDDNPWVFPAIGKTGHISEPKLNVKEVKLFPCEWSPHTLRHTWITISENKIPMPSIHSRLLSNHTVPKSRDAHLGYIHPDLEDLRRSQEMMSAFLSKAIKRKRVKHRS
jgi:integrase